MMMNVEELSLREKAAQLLFPRLGSNMPPPITAAEDIERFNEEVLDRCPVGGLIVFNGNLDDTPRVLAELQQRSRIPLLVSTDMERGVGQQIRGATIFPHAMAFSAAGATYLERAARVQAREALACGLHITFAPDADVNLDPRNPIIATRAFSDNPHEAAELVRAYLAGCRTEGLLTTAKHFPGHGNTHQDSHDEMPVVRAERDALLANDLVPFRAAIDAGVDLIMTAHVLYPAFDSENPATLSATILRQLLRSELGFEGVVITDSLLMGAIRPSDIELGRQAARLVAAGVDILLDIPDPLAAVDGIEAAVGDGSLDERLVDEAVGRIFALKRKMIERFGDEIYARASVAVNIKEVGSDEHRALADDIAAAGLHIADVRANVLPIPRDVEGGLLSILIKPHRSRFDPVEEPFADAVRDVFPGSIFRQVGPETDERFYEELRELAAMAEYIVLALVVKPAAWHTFGLREEQAEFVRETVERYAPIIVSLGSPYILEPYANAGVRICAFSDVEASQRAVVKRLAEIRP